MVGMSKMASESFSLKEMVKEQRDDMKVVRAAIESIDQHLTKLNSKVADHEERMQKTEKGLSAAEKKILYASAIVSVLVVVAELWSKGLISIG